jgi:hypothetical protein
MTKNLKKFTAEKKNWGGGSKTIIVGLHKRYPTTEEVLSPQQRTSSTSKDEIS